MSYRVKKVKPTPRQVLRDIIEEYTEEIKLAGGIGCFENGMPLESLSSVSNNDQRKSDFGYNTASSTLSYASPRIYKQWKGENREDIEYLMETRINTHKVKRYEKYDSRSSRSHISYKQNDEYTRTERYSPERKSYHQNHRSSHGNKSSSDYKTKKNDPYDQRRSKIEESKFV